MPVPVLQIACLEKLAEKLKEAFVGNLLAQQAQEDSMVNGIERSYN
jgi:hypothetical protein